MPFVHLYYPDDFSNKQEEFKLVSNIIHGALIDHFNIPENDYFQLFSPYPSSQFFYDPSYLLKGEDKRTDKMIHVSITCGPGRSLNQKKNLYHSISKAVSDYLNIPAANIFIILNETPAENWSFGQGIAQLAKEEQYE
jgi:phenylpyruvate tautomerase PptA (4-oxalocrotonate tautomerase family)